MIILKKIIYIHKTCKEIDNEPNMTFASINQMNGVREELKMQFGCERILFHYEEH